MYFLTGKYEKIDLFKYIRYTLNNWLSQLESPLKIQTNYIWNIQSTKQNRPSCFLPAAFLNVDIEDLKGECYEKTYCYCNLGLYGCKIL